MKDIISVHLGQAGVQMGLALWELYGNEHDLTPEGRMNETADRTAAKQTIGINTFYRQISDTHFVPRAILVDLEPNVIDSISQTKFANLFQSSFSLKGVEDASNNFARGFHTLARDMMPKLTDTVRSQIEATDKMQGFMLFRSMGGGTGSGLGSRLIQHFADEFTKKPSMEIAVFPSKKMASAVVEPYNTILATQKTLDLSKCVIYTDNQAIYNICNRLHDMDIPTDRNLNSVLSQAVSSITASLRMHFPIVSISPVVGNNFTCSKPISEITSRVFESPSRLTNYPDEESTHMSCCLLYRGDITTKDVNECVYNLKQQKKVKMVPWAPTGFKIGICKTRPKGIVNGECLSSERSACLLSNNTGLRIPVSEILKKYELMLSKGAFLHWYIGEGLEQNDFKTALEDTNTLVADYNSMQS